MQSWRRSLLIVIAALVATLGCSAPPATTRQVTSPGSPAEPAPATNTRATAAILGDPRTLSATMNTNSTGGQPGVEEVQRLIHAGLAIRDDTGALRPQLGDMVPTLENGRWKLQPDGQMEMTWKIRDGARWHDGTTLTAGDLVFTTQVGQDRELPLFRSRAFNAIDSVEATDASTVTVKWREPYIWADQLFTAALAMPLPKHLLEPTFSNDKARFVELPYWTEEFIGTGPYRVREWARGSHLILQANDGYLLGRPKINEIEVKFIPDANTMTANILAGAVELTMGRGFSIDSAAELREQWRDGNVAIALDNWVALYPQGINPNPTLIANVEFRRALVHAMDRQEMVQSIQHGLVPVAHTILSPEDALYKDVERSIVKYDYDPRQAMQMISQLGIPRAADGTLSLAPIEIRAAGTQGDSSNKGMFVVADFWKRLGLTVETTQIPNQRRNDLEYRATHPGFTIQRQPGGEEGMQRYHSREAPVPENNFVGDNKGRYMNPELDALLDRYFVTIARGERVQLGSQIVQHMTGQVTPLGLFYDANAVVIGKRLENIIAVQVGWNSHEWAVKS